MRDLKQDFLFAVQTMLLTDTMSDPSNWNDDRLDRTITSALRESESIHAQDVSHIVKKAREFFNDM